MVKIVKMEWNFSKCYVVGRGSEAGVQFFSIIYAFQGIWSHFRLTYFFIKFFLSFGCRQTLFYYIDDHLRFFTVYCCKQMVKVLYFTVLSKSVKVATLNCIHSSLRVTVFHVDNIFSANAWSEYRQNKFQSKNVLFKT